MALSSVRSPSSYVLVLDDDPSMRRLLRTGLELEGFSVLESASLGQARALLLEPLAAVVLDRQLPDGDGLDVVEEIRAARPQAVVVVHSDLGGPPELTAASKGDIEAILEVLDGAGVPKATAQAVPPGAGRVAGVVRTRIHELWDEWCELCEWDPEQPPDSRPVVATPLIEAISDALERPQPLGWGLDPALEPAAEALALNSPSLDVAMSQLVCLREAFERQVVQSLPAEEQPEANHRLNMMMLRLMVVVGRFGVAQLEADAFTDPLTGLLNRRAFERELDRERARARRHERPLTLAIVDVDGLKRVNDERGHREGDKLLRALARALTGALRHEDSAYRIGGDEFAVVFPDTALSGPDQLERRLRESGAPRCTIGMASAPVDHLDDLMDLADRRLYEQRAV